MNLTTYYWEADGLASGRFQALNDAHALRLASERKDLLCLYKESDTADGLPFIILYEKIKDSE